MRTTGGRARLASASVALVGLLAVAGCKGGSAGPSNDDPPADRLAAAKASLDGAQYIGFTLATDDLPEGVDGLVKAEGTGTHDPAFTGDVDVSSTISISAPLVAVGGIVYAKLPIVGWREIDPGDYGAPDPATLMSTDAGLSSLFTATVDPTAGDQVRQGDQVLDTIDGTIPGATVKTVFPSSGAADFDVTYSLTSDDDIAAIDVTGPFYDGSPDVTYALTFDLDADAVDIQPPT